MTAAFCVLLVAVVAHVTATVSGVATSSAAAVRITDVIYVAVGVISAVLIALRARHVEAERNAWWCLAGSMALFSLGNLLWNVLYVGLEDPPYPSWADGAWALYYLPTYAGLALLMRARFRDLPRAVVLDGMVSALGLAALVAALVLGPILAATGGESLAVVVNIVYPIGDLVLLALCVAALTLTRGRPGAAWLVLIGGLAANAAADTTYLFQAATGSYVDGGPLDVLWVLGMASVAVAAWQAPQEEGVRAPGFREHAVPAVFSVAAFALLGVGAASNSSMPTAAVVLAIATIVATGVRVALVVRDVQNLAESRRMAESDELTGLLNRRGLTERLGSALNGAREDAAPMSLLLLDLDGFKEVNDTLGHHTGDELLREVARRLRASLPEITLARLGGDEFVALLACDSAEALARATRLRAELDLPVVLDGLTTHTPASIGVACSSSVGTRSGDLLRCADVAMYRAKRRRTGVELYAPDGDANSRTRLALVAELRVALRDPAQLHLHYQPQIDLTTGSVTRLEALARWQHPRHGLLMPDSFLDLAEQHALMHDLTLAVLEQTLRQQHAWRLAGIELAVAINISAADLIDENFPTSVAEAVRAHEVPASALQFELTETTVMREPGRALNTLERLSALGVTLSLDDFGTGYSSLAHLKRLPVRELKIDRSFVNDMMADEDDAIIVRSMLELGRSLGLRVVAEGVETTEQLERLRYFGCHVAQGYLISRPMPAADIPGWLAEYSPARRVAGQRSPAHAVGPHGDADVLTPLLQVAGLIVDGAAPATIWRELCQELQAVVPHDALVVYRLEPSDFTLTAVHANGWCAEHTATESFPAHEGITGAALREGRVRNVARTDLDPDSVPIVGAVNEPEALVCCPMRAGADPLGVFNVYRSGRVLPFSSEDVAIVERFAAVAALVLRRDAEAGATPAMPAAPQAHRTQGAHGARLVSVTGSSS